MSGRVVYFDLASGAGGDMLMASLVDAGRRMGADVESVVQSAVRGLKLGCDVAFNGVTRGGLASVHGAVSTDGRSFSAAAMRDAIRDTDATDGAKAGALLVIDALVAAEASVHGIEVSEVHLHELGSADTAADAIGVAAAIDSLGIGSVTAAPVPMPSGWADTDHGRIPIPAPATVEILRGAAVAGVTSASELVTPTAAAILVAHDCTFGPTPPMTLESVGTGAGTAEFTVPNVCRAFVGQTAEVDPSIERIVQLDANIDDQTPEALGHAIESLLAAGAVDAWVTPIVMKKSRPAFALSVLVHEGDEPSIIELLFRETTTLGVRRRETQRWVAEREEMIVAAAGECIRVKVSYFHGARVGATPEFADCVRASKKTGVPVKEVYAEASAAASRALGPLR